MTTRIERCKDGSDTVYSELFGQFYHNPNGAVAESLHVFFEISGIFDAIRDNNTISVLEVGFGTGLNALLLADFVAQSGSGSQVNFQSIEAWPISPEMAKSLNYGDFLKTPELAQKLEIIFTQLQDGNAEINLLPNTKVNVHKGLFSTFSPNSRTPYNFVFHDAFSPEVNSELWTPEVFEVIRRWSSDDAVLTTYCAATRARAAMAMGGWFPFRAPGALGKREMTVASANPRTLDGFKPLDVNKLRAKYTASPP
jgi:tRNA U34 5-methylaminomethyl-2-thiouridine-forming methyltransferase MnmC